MNEHWREFDVVRGWHTVAPIFEVLNGRGYIGGSWAAFMATVHDTPLLPNDIDIFCTAGEKVAEEIAGDLERENIAYIYDWNEVAWTLHHAKKYSENQPDIQVINANPAWVNFPDDILSDFDLDVCRAILISPTKVLADENIGMHIGKLLRINNPLRSLKRVIKYSAREVAFNDHELLKLFLAWDQTLPERKEALIKRAEEDLLPQESGSDEVEYDQDEWFDAE